MSLSNDRTPSPSRRLILPRRAGQTRGSGRGERILLRCQPANRSSNLVSEPSSCLTHLSANQSKNDTPSSDVRRSSAGELGRSTACVPSRRRPAPRSRPSWSARPASSSAPPTAASNSATCSSGPKTSMSGAYTGRGHHDENAMTGTRNDGARAWCPRGGSMATMCRRLSFTRPTRVVGLPAASTPADRRGDGRGLCEARVRASGAGMKRGRRSRGGGDERSAEGATAALWTRLFVHVDAAPPTSATPDSEWSASSRASFGS